MSEAYDMTNDWITATNERRQQNSLRKYAKYTEDDSVDDDYLEDISTYSKLRFLYEVCLLHCILPSSISIRE